MRQISFFQACAGIAASFGLWTMVLLMSPSVKSDCYMKNECSGISRSGNSSECTFSQDFLRQTKWSGSVYDIFKRTDGPRLIQSYSVIYSSSQVRNNIDRVVLEFGITQNRTCMLHTSYDNHGFQVELGPYARTIKYGIPFQGSFTSRVFGLAVDCEGQQDWLFLSEDNSSITVKMNESTYICYKCISQRNSCGIAFMHMHG